MPAITHLLYLHGFRSSPRSAKARQVAARVRERHPEVHWWCPQLPASPRETAAMLEQGCATWPAGSMAVIGSSLGGYYATWVAERFGCKAVLLNPAVDPARDLAAYVGDQPAWHDPTQHVRVEPRHGEELRALRRGPLKHPERYYAVIAKGDEVLDWREMVGRYPGARIRLLEGSDHALSDFDAHIDGVFSFLDPRA